MVSEYSRPEYTDANLETLLDNAISYRDRMQGYINTHEMVLQSTPIDRQDAVKSRLTLYYTGREKYENQILEISNELQRRRTPPEQQKELVQVLKPVIGELASSYAIADQNSSYDMPAGSDHYADFTFEKPIFLFDFLGANADKVWTKIKQECEKRGHKIQPLRIEGLLPQAMEKVTYNGGTFNAQKFGGIRFIFRAGGIPIFIIIGAILTALLGLALIIKFVGINPIREVLSGIIGGIKTGIKDTGKPPKPIGPLGIVAILAVLGIGVFIYLRFIRK